MVESNTNYSESEEKTNISTTDSGEACKIEGEGIDFEYVGPYLHEPNGPSDNQTHVKDDRGQALNTPRDYRPTDMCTCINKIEHHN